MIKNLFTFATFMVLIFITGLLISCGGSWVDVAQVTFFTDHVCSDKDVEKFKTEELGLMIVKETCSRIGKTYAGDVRCKKGSIQVKCE